MFFFIFFSIMVYHGMLMQFPVLYRRTLLFIYPIYNNLPLLIPSSHSFPPLPSLLFGNQKSVPYIFLL